MKCSAVGSVVKLMLGETTRNHQQKLLNNRQAVPVVALLIMGAEFQNSKIMSDVIPNPIGNN